MPNLVLNGTAARSQLSVRAPARNDERRERDDCRRDRPASPEVGHRGGRLVEVILVDLGGYEKHPRGFREPTR